MQTFRHTDMLFEGYIGIDYSGAGTSETRLKGLQVYEALDSISSTKVNTTVANARNWTRSEIAKFCVDRLCIGIPIIIGIDHAFSFPKSYMDRYKIMTWDYFLDDFKKYWPADNRNVSVESLRRDNSRKGAASELRLCERWTAGAKSVFRFDVQGQVAKSTHAGLPWLRSLRKHKEIRSRVHFWPFDGFDVPHGMSVITEVYPSLFRRRYSMVDRTVDEQDAFATAKWLSEMDQYGNLKRYFSPPLTKEEAKLAHLEGWILGVY